MLFTSASPVRKPKLREVIWLAQGHPDGGAGLKPNVPDAEPTLFISIPGMGDMQGLNHKWSFNRIT